MSWKDDYREAKDESGKTWDEFVKTELHHESELNDLRSEVETLNEHVEAVKLTYKDLKDELASIRILANRD